MEGHDLPGESDDEAPALDVLELRDVVLTDLVHKSVSAAASKRKQRVAPPDGGFATRAGQDPSFVAVPAGGKELGGMELLEQTNNFQEGTKQRLLWFGAARIDSSLFSTNGCMWKDHSNEVGVLIHLHDAHAAAARGARQADFGKKSGGTPRAVVPEGRTSNKVNIQQYKKTHSYFFLQPGDYNEGSVQIVRKRRQEQCDYAGSKFSHVHCESFVEILHGRFGFDSRLPALNLAAQVTDRAVRQYLEAHPSVKVPLTVRINHKGSWTYIRSRDQNKTEIVLKDHHLHLFVGLWLSLQRLWNAQYSTEHPHPAAPATGVPSTKLQAVPEPNIDAHLLESRGELSVLRQEFFFVVKPFPHLWGRYLCEYTAFIASFSRRSRVWVDCLREALCVSVLVPPKMSKK